MGLCRVAVKPRLKLASCKAPPHGLRTAQVLRALHRVTTGQPIVTAVRQRLSGARCWWDAIVAPVVMKRATAHVGWEPFRVGKMACDWLQWFHTR